MTGNWASDPYGRAELRYHDGQRWTEHVTRAGVQGIDHPGEVPPPPVFGGGQRPGAFGAPPSFPAYAAADAAAPTGTPGKLLAAGIMTLIESALGIIIALWLFSVSASELGDWVDDVSGGAITFAGVMMLAVAVTGLVVGINDCRGRNWARITTIVLHAIGLALVLIGMVSSLSDESNSNPAGGLIPLVWYGVIIYLAASAKPAR